MKAETPSDPRSNRTPPAIRRAMRRAAQSAVEYQVASFHSFLVWKRATAWLVGRKPDPKLAPLPKNDVQHNSSDQNDHREHGRTLVPRQFFFRSFRQRINQTYQLFFIACLRGNTHQNRNYETGRPRKDCGPESLGQFARVNVHCAEPTAFDARVRAHGQSQSLMNRRADRAGD